MGPPPMGAGPGTGPPPTGAVNAVNFPLICSFSIGTCTAGLKQCILDLISNIR
jgi:hypothetical protein